MVSHVRRNSLLFAAVACVIAAGATCLAADSSVKELTGLLNTPDVSARLKAIDKLGAQGQNATEAVAPLAQLLKDGTASVRAHAARALGDIGESAKPVVSDLISLLKDSDDAVRRQTVRALIAIHPGPQVGIPLFIKLMEDSDPGVQMRVLNAITEAGAAAVPGLIEGLKNDKTTFWACVVLRQIGPDAKDAVPTLAEKLKDPRAEIRQQAVLALGAMGEAAMVAQPKLVAALDDEHTHAAATFVLGQLGKIPANVEATIRANTKSNDSFLSTVSVWALANVHPEDKDFRRQATEQLIERLKDQDPFVRVVAARALAALPPAPEITLPIWEKTLKDADTATVHHALDALATLGAPAVPSLVNILERHKELRVEAIYALGQIGPGAVAATKALAKLAADEDFNVATEAVLALGKIGPAAKDAVPTLSAAFQRPHCLNAHAIIFALGEIGPQAAAAKPVVVQALNSQDKSLAIIGAWSLTQIEPRSAETAARVIPVLVAGFSDALPESRKAAAEALGELGPLARTALPALQKATEDRDKSVRQAAGEAIKKVQ